MAESTGVPLTGSTISAPGGAPASGTASDTAAGARSSGDTIRAGGERALSDAKAKMIDAAEVQRRRAVDAVRGMAGALHRAAGDLGKENETMGRYTDMAAERLDQFAGYLRGTSLAELMDETEDLARRQPAWFIGGAMAAGFLVARLIKNATPAETRTARASRYGRRMAASSGVGYGTSTEAGVMPATTATTQPISSATRGEV